VNRKLIQQTLQNTGFLDHTSRNADAGEGIREAFPTEGGEALKEEPVSTVEESSPGKDEEERAAETEAGEEPPVEAAPVVRQYSIYLIQVDNDGLVVRVKVPRELPLSNTPLMDTLKALMKGPDKEEENRGLISLIPQGTRILSVIVRGTTAYINVSEDFLFTEYGVQGYEGQLEQVVWTATEFPTIRDVQILIEGRVVDYLGESVSLGSPRSRASF